VAKAAEDNGPLTGRPIAPNDFAVAFGAIAGKTVEVV
jgi:hypothetical protein